MSNITDISQYDIIGTLADNNNFSAWIASETNSAGIENLCLVNRFPHSKGNQQIFKDFFSYYSSPNRSKDMVNFFASKDSFYIVFKYTKAECITDRFDEEKTTTDYNTRCAILHDILIKLQSISDLPLPAFVNASAASNICIDNDNKIQIIYNLNRLPDKQSATTAMVFDHIAEIIRLIFKHELNNRYNNQFHIILEKCDNHLYSSIPQLIVELEKAEKKPQESVLNASVKQFMAKHKKMIKRLSIIGGAGVGVLAVVLILNSLFGPGNKTSSSGEDVIAVGNIKYSTASNQNTDITIDPKEITTSSSTSGSEIDFTLPANTDILSEDYIVQYGDTLESICESHYSSQDFVKTLETFNNISNVQLVAGMIIKLPDETAASDFFLY